MSDEKMEFEDFVEEFIKLSRESIIRTKLSDMVSKVIGKFIKTKELDFEEIDKTAKDLVEGFYGKDRS